MSTLKILIDTRALLSDSSKWCKFRFAQNRNGLASPCKGSDAVSWCLAGALYRCADDDESSTSAIEAVRAVLPAGDHRSQVISRFNDGATHLEVLALLDAAITAEQHKARQRRIDDLRMLADLPACEPAAA